MKSIRYINRKSGKILLEKPPGEKFLRFLYHNPIGALPLHLIVKRKYLSYFYGKLMHKSKSKENISSFVKEYNIDMSESIKKEFLSFNDFFIRKLKKRKIDSGFVSPADGKILAFENVKKLNSFFVKGRKFTLDSFLKNKILARKYTNATLFLIRLAPNDYHRFHFPISGKVSSIVKIKGKYFSVSPYALFKNFTRVFCSNKREYCIIQNDKIGDVIVSPVGATMVGTIIETYKPNTNIKKGDEMGYFSFGGSSIVIIANNVKIDSDILLNTKKGLETSISMGERIASF